MKTSSVSLTICLRVLEQHLGFQDGELGAVDILNVIIGIPILKDGGPKPSLESDVDPGGCSQCHTSTTNSCAICHPPSAEIVAISKVVQHGQWKVVGGIKKSRVV